MTDNPPVIPSGPIEREPLDFRPGTEKETLLRDTLHAAGVDLGAYDERIVHWFAMFADWGTFAVITSWVQRASEEKPYKQ